MFKALKREAAKFEFVLTIQSLEAFVPPTNSTNSYCISWKRGAKRGGKTEFAQCNDGSIVWNSTFSFNGTLYKEKAPNSYRKKTMNISLEEQNKKKALSVAVIDIAKFCKDEGVFERSDKVEMWIGREKFYLQLSFKTQCVKANLQAGEDSMSLMTATVDDGGGSDDELDYENRRSSLSASTSTGGSSGRYLVMIKELQQQVQDLQALKDSQSDEGKQQIAKMIEDLNEGREKIKQLEKERDSLKQELTASNEQSAKVFEAQLKIFEAQKSAEAAKQNSATLSEQLEAKTNEANTLSGELTDLQEKFAVLKAVKAEDEKLIEALQAEIALLKTTVATVSAENASLQSTLEAQSQRLEATISEKNATVETLQSEIANMRSEMEKSKQSNVTINQLTNALTVTETKPTHRFKQHQLEHLHIRDLSGKLSNELRENLSEVISLRIALGSLQLSDTISQQSEAKMKLQERVISLERQHQLFAAKLASKAELLANEITALNEIKEKYAAIQKELLQSQARQEELHSNASALIDKLENTTKQHSELQNDIEASLSKVTNQWALIESLAVERDQLQLQLSRLLQANAAANQQMADILQQWLQLLSDVSNTEITQLSASNAELIQTKAAEQTNTEELQNERDVYKQQNIQLQSLLDIERNELAQLKNEQAMNSLSLQTLENERNELQKRELDLETQLREAKDQFEKQTAELALLQTNAAKESEDLQMQLSQSTERVNALTDAIAAKERELSDANSAIETIRNQLATESLERNNLNTTVGELQAQLQSSTETIAQMNATVKDLETKLSQANSDLEAAEAKHTSFNSQLTLEHEKLKAEIDSLTAERAASASQFAAEKEDLTQQLTDAKAKARSLQQELESEQERNSSLSEELAQAHSKLLTQEIEATNSLSAATMVKERLQQRLNSTNTELEEAMKKIEEQKEQIIELEAACESANSRIITLQSNHDSLLQQQRLLIEHNETIAAERDAHNERTIAQFMQQIADANQQIDGLKRELATSRESSNEYSDAIIELQSQVEQLRCKLAQSDEENVLLREEIQQLSSANAEHVQSLEIVTKEKDALSESCTTASGQVTQLSERISSLENETAQYQQKIGELQSISEQLESAKTSLSCQLEELRTQSSTEVDALKTALNTAEESLTQTKQLLDVETAKAAQLRCELTAAQSERDSISAKYSAAEQQLHDIQQQLEEQAQQTKHSIESLTTQNSQLTSERDALSEKLKLLVCETGSLKLKWLESKDILSQVRSTVLAELHTGQASITEMLNNELRATLSLYNEKETIATQRIMQLESELMDLKAHGAALTTSNEEANARLVSELESERSDKAKLLSDIASATETISTLETLRDQQQAQLKELASKLKGAERQIAMNAQITEVLRSDKDILHTQAAELQETIRRLQDEATVARESLTQYQMTTQAEIDSLKAANDQAAADLASANKTITELQADLSRNQTTITALEARLQQDAVVSKESSDAREQQLTSTIQQIRETESKLNEIERQHAVALASLESIRVEKQNAEEALQQQKMAFEGAEKEAEAKAMALTNALADAEAKSREHEARAETLSATVSQLEAANEKLRTEYAEIESTIAVLKEENEQLQLASTKAAEHNEALTAKLSAQENESMRITAELNLVIEERDKLTNDKHALTQALQTTEAALTQSKSDADKQLAAATALDAAVREHEQSISALNSEIESLRAESAIATQRIHDLSAQIQSQQVKEQEAAESIRKLTSERDEALAALTLSGSQLSGELSAVKASLVESTQKLSQSEQQKEQLQSTVDQLTAEKTALEERISAIESELQQTTSKLTSLEAEYNNKLAERDATIETQRSNESALNASIASLTNKNDEAKNEIAALNEVNKALQTQLDAMKGDNASTLAEQASELAALKLAHDALQTQAQSSNELCEKLKRDVEASQAESSELQSQIAQLNEDIETAKSQLAEKAQELEEASKISAAAATASLAAREAELKSRIDELEAALNTETAAKTSLSEELEALKSTQQSSAEGVEKLQSEIEQLKQQNQSEIAILQSEKQTLQSSVDEANKQLEDLKAQLSETEGSLQDHSAAVSEAERLSAEVQQLTAAIALLKSEHSTELNEQELKLQKEISTLREQINEMTANQQSTSIVEQVNTLTKERLEKYVLERSVLLIDPEYYTPSKTIAVPLSAKLLWRSLTHWDSFDVTKNNTFLKNTIAALDYAVQRKVDEVEMLSYWMMCCSYILEMVRKQDAKTVITTMNLLKTSQMELSFEDVLGEDYEKRNVRLPVFFSELEFGDAGASSDATASTSGSSSPRDPSADYSTPEAAVRTFVTKVHTIAVKAFANLLLAIFRQLDKHIANAIFKADESPSNRSGSLYGGKSQMLFAVLDSYHSQLTSTPLPSHIIKAVFEHVETYMDVCVFNSLMQQKSNAGKGLKIKLAISSFESWFVERQYPASFTFSRQAADVCVIAQKDLLTDEDMRSAVCPRLSKAQIFHLLSSYDADEFDRETVSPELLQGFKSSSNLSELEIKLKLRLFTNGEGNASLFDLRASTTPEIDHTSVVESVVLPGDLISSKVEELSFLC